ncbi:hypothetical protein J6590_015413 [Homalodisca vitripennis]|nr:hypothetical protein J6590_015413 [Homalodisca vitripennis]
MMTLPVKFVRQVLPLWQRSQSSADIWAKSESIRTKGLGLSREIFSFSVKAWRDRANNKRTPRNTADVRSTCLAIL